MISQPPQTLLLQEVTLQLTLNYHPWLPFRENLEIVNMIFLLRSEWVWTCETEIDVVVFWALRRRGRKGVLIEIFCHRKKKRRKAQFYHEQRGVCMQQSSLLHVHIKVRTKPPGSHPLSRFLLTLLTRVRRKKGVGGGECLTSPVDARFFPWYVRYVLVRGTTRHDFGPPT